MKKIFISLQTSGFNSEKHGIIEISAAVEIDGVFQDQYDCICRPSVKDECDQAHLERNGLTEDSVRDKSRTGANPAFKGFIDFLDCYIDRFNKADKATLYAYNVQFAMDFLTAWFKKQGNDYIFSYFTTRPVCIMNLVRYLDSINASKITALPDIKLPTVCKEFGVPINTSKGIANGNTTALLYFWYRFEPYMQKVIA